MPTPKPNQPVRGSSTGRPIMALLDLLGRRWMLRIMWELREAPLGFRDLQAHCDAMSSSVLARRLTELAEAGITAQDSDDRHHLTAEGLQLLDALKGLNAWAERWSERDANQ